MSNHKNPYVNKVAKRLTLNQTTIDYVNDYWSKNNCRSFSEAFDRIIDEAKANQANQLIADVIATTTAEKIVDMLKRSYLDPLRIRTGYADKQTKALLEVMNHVIVKNGWDAENVVTTDVRKANVLTAADEKITKQIEHFKQNKATKEAQRKKNDQ